MAYIVWKCLKCGVHNNFTTFYGETTECCSNCKTKHWIKFRVPEFLNSIDQSYDIEMRELEK